MTFRTIYFLLFAFFLVNNANAQKGTVKLEEYTASNGVTYKVGDRLKLKVGTGNYFYFKSMSRGWGYINGIEEQELPSVFANNIVTIKKIKRWDRPEFQGVMFSMSHDFGEVFYIDIEMALKLCEVANCIDDKELYEIDHNYKRKPNYVQMAEYTASNGISYKVGDSIKLAKGSTRNGNFSFLRDVGNGKMSLYTKDQAKAKRANTTVFIEKIKKYNLKYQDGVFFTVKVDGRIANSVLDIESAIATCEIEECKRGVELNASTTERIVKNKPTKSDTPVATTTVVSMQQSDKYDQLLKIKKLLDEGILTEKEYQVEKKKILEKEK